MLYASVGSGASTYSDTVAVIDPSSGSVSSTIAVGQDPHRLALSQDGSYLYVGADGINSVQRIVLASKAIDETISLGSEIAGDIEVMPGSPGTVAIAMKLVGGSPAAAGVALYDGTTMRQSSISPPPSGYWIDVIAFSPSGAMLYGLDNEVSGFEFVRMNVTASGLSVQDSTHALLGWGYGASMVSNGSMIYSTFGTVVDPSSLTLQGRFPANPSSLPNQQTVPFAESVLVDSGVPYLLTHDGANVSVITAYDPQNYLQSAFETIDVNSESEASLQRCGSTGFAFIAYSLGSGGTVTRSVVITKSSMTPVAPSTPSLPSLLANHIVWDPGTARVYASVPSLAGSFGNSVAVINPLTQVVEATIFVGSEPDALAVSDDSQYLYVGLDGAGAIARVNLASRMLEAQYPLLYTPSLGPVRAEQIAVMPASPHTYVANLRYIAAQSPNDAGTAVYDDGVQRPSTVAGNDEIAFSDLSSTLYGYGYQVTGSVQVMAINSTGISITSTIPGPMVGTPTRIQYYSGTLYSSSGRAIMPATPALAGTFTVTTPRDFGIDGPGGYAYFLTDNATTRKATLLRYDLNKFVLTAYQDVAAAAGSGSEIADCGSNGFAVLLSPGIIFANGTFTPSPPLGPSAVNLLSNHLIWNSATGQLIASVPGFVGPGGNSIAVIDPTSETITSSFFVGSEPGQMALSSDGGTLFVGLRGSGSVAQVDLSSGSVTYTTSLGFISGGPLLPNYVSVSPADPNVAAVSRSDGGVVVLDLGSQLPNLINSPFNDITSITFGTSGTNLYGYNNVSSSFDFYLMNVGPSGVTMTGDYSRLFYGFYAGIQNLSGLIYSTNGTVVNPVIPALQGGFPGANASVGAFFDGTRNEAYFLNYDPTKSSPTTISRYSLSNYSYIDSTPVTGQQSQGWDLVRYGSNGVAFATSSGLSFATVSTAPPQPPTLANLTVRHLLTDALRNRIYATVPGTVPAIGNSVAIIDPVNSVIVNTIAVGSEPDVLAMSADGAYLYVGLDGSASIARVNLTTNSVDLTFSMGTNSSWGAFVPASISVSPLSSTTIAVARAFPTLVPSQAGVAIYTNGVMLPNTTPATFGTGSGTIAFCSSGSNLYGFDNQTTGFGFYTMSVDNSGVQTTGQVQGLIVGAADILCDNDVIYATTGYAVDPLNNTQLGVFPNMLGAAAVTVDDGNKKVFFLTTNTGNAVSINGFDQSSYSQTGTFSVTGATTAGRDLVRWGTNGFAVATQNQVLILSGTLP